MTHGTRLGIIAAVLPLVGAGCATVQWTEELVAGQAAWTTELFTKQEAEIDERFVAVETRAHEQHARIDRVEARVASVETGLTETRALATKALAGATSTAAVRSDAIPRGASPRAAESVPGPTRTLVSVVHVPFGRGRATLDTAATVALGAIVKELRANPRITIDLDGTTDTAGSLDYNVRLSERRVEAVKRWLVANGVERPRIVHEVGRGPLADATIDEAHKRRVSVKLMTRAE
jgi:outer membrane protein OmpA-like peptidoglycan-associated protein